MATKKAAALDLIEIKPIEIQQMTIKVVGDTPLIEHAWSEKAKKEMLDAQTGKAKIRKKQPKNPMEDFIRSMYWLTPMPEEMTEEAYADAIANGARFGFPVTAFKQAAISAAYRMGWTKDKMSLRGAFFIESDNRNLVEIHSEPPEMSEEMVKVGMGIADIRYRGKFNNWSANLVLKINKNAGFTPEQIVNIINAGGFVCGIGEWRPERDGQYGMFHVEAS